MAKLNKSKREEAKRIFSDALHTFVSHLNKYVSAEDGEWTVKGFIDVL